MLQQKVKSLRESIHGSVGGNIGKAFDIVSKLISNMKCTINSDGELRAAMSEVDLTNGDNYVIDHLIIDNAKEYFAHEAHRSKGSHPSTMQHMLDAILCALSSSKSNQVKVSFHQLAR